MAEDKKLSTESYKGVRDFYPEDMAIQSYIFETWEKTAESFGFLHYDASVLEPAELYTSKGAQNEEIINEQSYTFTDKGDRLVTLRPEMTPTAARMVAGRRRELQFPLRWYSIPNVFRYERAQRGRLREHWQLNCDIFGTHERMADIEIIMLAHAILTNFGASESDFVIKINNRELLRNAVVPALKDEADLPKYLYLLDRKAKMSREEFESEEATLLKHGGAVTIEPNDEVKNILTSLAKLGVGNAQFDESVVRGFDYYTGTVFEIFDTNPDNRRSLLGGGRYDNLTSLFGGEPIPGIGFGMGDVTMRDFLETHDLLPAHLLHNRIDVAILLPDLSDAIHGQTAARELRTADLNVAVDYSGKKLGDQISRADKLGATHIIVVGDKEMESGEFTMKRLSNGAETRGSLAELVKAISQEALQ